MFDISFSTQELELKISAHPSSQTTGFIFSINMKYILLLILCHSFAFSNNASALETPKRKLQQRERTPVITVQKSSFCQIHEQVEKGDVELRYALRDLDIAIGAQDNVIDRYGKINEGHIAVRILDEVAKRANFNWRDTVEAVDPPLQSQTWTDVLNYTTSNYDLALDYWMRTIDRVIIGMTFPQEWFDSSMIMIQINEQAGHEFKWLVNLPFTWEVWLLILLTMFVTALVYYVIDFITYNEHKETATISDSIYYSFQVLTGTSKYNPDRLPNRLLLISLRVLSIFLLAAFRANLTAFLLNQSEDVTINVIEDAIHRNYRICVRRGTPDVLSIQKQYPTGQFIEKDSQLEVYKGLQNGECEMGLDNVDSYESFKNKVEYNPNCNIQWLGKEVTSTKASFGIKGSEEYCASLLRDVLSLHLLEMDLDGTTSKIMQSERSIKTANCNLDSQTTYNGQLRIVQMSGIYAVYTLAMVLAVVSSIILRIKHPENLEITKTVTRQLSRLSTKYLGALDVKDDETTTSLENKECDDLSPNEKMLQKLIINLHTELKAELIKELNEKIDQPVPPNLHAESKDEMIEFNEKIDESEPPNLQAELKDMELNEKIDESEAPKEC